MTTTTNPTIVDTIRALVPDELRARCQALTADLQAITPSIVALVERSQAIETELKSISDHHERALVDSVDPDRAADIADGWGWIFDCLNSAQYRSLFYALHDIVGSFGDTSDSTGEDSEVSE